MASKPHSEQGYRSCLGMLRLGKQYSPARLEAACGRAIEFNACSYRSATPQSKAGCRAAQHPVSVRNPADDRSHCPEMGLVSSGTLALRLRNMYSPNKPKASTTA